MIAGYSSDLFRQAHEYQAKEREDDSLDEDCGLRSLSIASLPAIPRAAKLGCLE